MRYGQWEHARTTDESNRRRRRRNVPAVSRDDQYTAILAAQVHVDGTVNRSNARIDRHDATRLSRKTAERHDCIGECPAAHARLRLGVVEAREPLLELSAFE